MNPFKLWTKETPVSDETTPATVQPAPPVNFAEMVRQAALQQASAGSYQPLTAQPAGPIQEALDTILDSFALATIGHPVVHAGVLGLKLFVDRLSPLIATALAAKGIKIVKA